MRPDVQVKAKKRLARIEGQVRGVAAMVEDGRYCIDIVRQVQAIKSALAGLERVVLEDHLETCVDTALRSDNLEQRREKVEELVAVLGGYKK
ncbi:MAG: metal-sensitive transcriptional regulator [Alphaproteobacteria bacterium]